MATKTVKLTLPEQALVALANERAQNAIRAAQQQQAQALQTIFSEHKIPDGLRVDFRQEDNGDISAIYDDPTIVLDANIGPLGVVEPPADEAVVGAINPS